MPNNGPENEKPPIIWPAEVGSVIGIIATLCYVTFNLPEIIDNPVNALPPMVVLLLFAGVLARCYVIDKNR